MGLHLHLSGSHMFVRLLASAAVAVSLLATAVPAQASSRIVAIVNGEPITQNQVNRRAAFMKLRRAKGGSGKARDELIDEAVKMQQARKFKVVASDKEVNEAFVRFAKGNKMPLKVLKQILGRAGVSERHFKEYIRTQISWQRAVPGLYRSKAQTAARKGCRDFTSCLSASDGSKKTTEVILQQVVFVAPKASAKARRQEAVRFRQRFSSCDATRAAAAKLNNVAVRDLGRMGMAQVPARWAADVAKVDQGGVTQPKITEKGVEMLAVCRKRNVAAMGEVALDEDVFRKEAPKLAEEYLAELKKKAKIVRR